MSQEPTPPDLPAWSPAAELEERAPAEGPQAHEWVLIRYVGHPMGEYIPIPAKGLEIGRAPENGLCLPELEVSRRHARMQISGDSAAVELLDLASTNGVFVNGRRVETDPGPLRLEAGDVVRVGAHAFKLKHMDALERRYHLDMAARTTLDPLTGVSNRATVLRQMEALFELARRHDRPLSVILADLDHFKRINDTRGHRAGDLALEAFGTLLSRRLRGSDPVGRLGGEEFLVVLPDTLAERALTAAEDLRRAFAELPLDLGDGSPAHLTCSFGVAAMKPGDADGGALLARADAALYSAKAKGRNRAVAAP